MIYLSANQCHALALFQYTRPKRLFYLLSDWLSEVYVEYQLHEPRECQYYHHQYSVADGWQLQLLPLLTTVQLLSI